LGVEVVTGTQIDRHVFYDRTDNGRAGASGLLGEDAECDGRDEQPAGGAGSFKTFTPRLRGGCVHLARGDRGAEVVQEMELIRGVLQGGDGPGLS
jgi:hypothetical protein